MDNSSLAKNAKGDFERYDFSLNSSFHIFATLLIGDPTDEKNTEDFYITAGSGTPDANPTFFEESDNRERHGVEVAI